MFSASLRPTASPWSRRLLSTKPIRILYGSQGGTAQVFGMQIQQELEEYPDREPPEFLALNEADSLDTVLKEDSLNVILVSVTGVGEPPDNGRDFYEYVMSEDSGLKLSPNIHYTVFGLGNSVAHPNHYNVIGKNIDSKLTELGAQRVFPLGLGDDGDCLEDDFDSWMDNFLDYAVHGKQVCDTKNDGETDANVVEDKEDVPSMTSETPSVSKAQHEPLQLKTPNELPVIRDNVLHVDFYQERVSRK